MDGQDLGPHPLVKLIPVIFYLSMFLSALLIMHVSFVAATDKDSYPEYNGIA